MDYGQKKVDGPGLSLCHWLDIRMQTPKFVDIGMMLGAVGA